MVAEAEWIGRLAGDEVPTGGANMQIGVIRRAEARVAHARGGDKSFTRRDRGASGGLLCSELSLSQTDVVEEEQRGGQVAIEAEGVFVRR